MTRFSYFAAALLAAAAMPVQAATVKDVMANARFKAAVAELDRSHEQTVQDIIALTEIPAPPFKEKARGEAYLEKLRAAGLSDVEMDAEGNVTGLWRGTGAPGGKLIVLAAHLDTVFPEGTAVKVKREGTRLSAPGIGDDTRSLAVLLAYVRAMKTAGVKTGKDILFVGNVGEEGPGDLRGSRYLFAKSKYKDRIEAFLSMDGTDGSRIVNGGVGSRRYRVTFTGPGGHSYGAFGLVNPMTAMGQSVVDLYKVEVPKSPKTTYSASVTGGGTSVNSIPNKVFMEFDMRSESAEELGKLEQKFLGIVKAAVDGENAARSTREGKIAADLKLIGDRPAGHTPDTAELVRVAQAAVAAQGLKPELETSSTDANVPMGLGIPGITIGSGGSGGRAHALDEWIDVEKGASLKGMLPGITMLLALADLQK